MREIKLTVHGDTVHASQYLAGVRGSANATTLVVTFDESWDGYAKQIVFWDALDQNPVTRILTADLLVDPANDTRTYKTAIPGEALAVAGECMLVIEGWRDTTRLRAMQLRLVVEYAPHTEPADPTPDQFSQMQGQYEEIIGVIQNAQLSAEEAENFRADAQTAAGQAAQYAANALASEIAAQQHEENANISAQEAEKHQTAAETAEAGAKEAEQGALASAERAEQAASKEGAYAEQAGEFAREAGVANESAQAAAGNAQASAQNAAASAQEAAEYRAAAEEAEGWAKESAEDAAQSEQNAGEHRSAAENAASVADEAKQGAQAAAERAEQAASKEGAYAEQAGTFAQEAGAANESAQAAAGNAQASAQNAAVSAQEAAESLVAAETAEAGAKEAEQGARSAAKRAEEAEGLAESYTSHPSIIGENGNWWNWDGEQYVDSGKPSQGELTVRQGNTLYANALKGTAGGEVVRLDDVSPLEHAVPVMVRVKNLFDYKAWVAWCNSGIGNTGVEDATYLGEDCFSYSLWMDSKTTVFRDIKFKENTQYTFSFEWSFSDTSGNNPSNTPFLIFYTDGSYEAAAIYSNDQTTFKKATYVSKASKTVSHLTVTRYSHTSTIYIKKNMQIEEGVTATGYTPYVAPSSVRLLAHGKNLVDPAAYGKDSTNTTVDGDVFTTTFENAGTFVNMGWGNKQVKHPPGTYTATFIPVSEGAVASLYVYAADDRASIANVYDLGLNNKTSLTFTANETFFISLGGSANKENRGTHSYKLQLEVGTTATEYEPYIVPVTYTPAEDGTCEVTSIAPTMTLTTDTEGAVVDCEYNRDINKAFEQLAQAILSMGGNI